MKAHHRILAMFMMSGLTIPITPLLAQDSERVNVVVVYGDDECPASVGDEIVVCPRLDESERYRIPSDLRGNLDAMEEQPWSNRVKAYEMVGASGAMSCSPSGAGGFTGCTQQLVGQYVAEKESSGNVRAGQLVEAEREKRLAELDQEAAEEQARVDALIAEQERTRAARDEAALPMDEPPAPEGNLPLP